MNIIFWVTEKCNLNCDYCYVKKQPKTMTLETAETAFVFFKKLLSERERQEGEIHIGFHGGEPLLNFPVIQYLIDKFEKEYGNKIRYFSLTTNGTVFDETELLYLMNRVQLSVSIDGMRQTNDRKRHYIDGRSSYDKTVQTLEYLKKHEVYCRVRMTVNTETVSSFADNFIFLDKKGYGVVTYAINTDDDWTQADMEVYRHELQKIMEYFLKEKPEDGKYFLYNLTMGNFRVRNYCDGGITNFHVSPDGGLYPCILSVDDMELKLGNVFGGIDRQAIVCLEEINSKKVQGCEKCEFQGHCESQVCKILNKKATGDYYTVPEISCREKRIIHSIYQEYKHILEGFNA